MRRRLALLAFLLVAPPVALAGEADTGIVADRFVPATGPGAFLGVESSEVAARGVPSLTLGGSGVSQPLRLVNPYNNTIVAQPVSAELTADAAIEVGVGARLAVGVGLPIVLRAGGDRLQNLGVGDDSPLATASRPRLGDGRLRLKWNALARRGFGIALVLLGTIPGGGQTDFAATANPTVELRAILDYRRRWLSASVNLGGRYAPDEHLFLTRFGSELHVAAAVAVTLPRGARSVTPRGVLEVESWIGQDRGTRPVEARAALGLVLPAGFLVDAGAGLGLDHDVAAPAWRVFLIARWSLPH